MLKSEDAGFRGMKAMPLRTAGSHINTAHGHSSYHPPFASLVLSAGPFLSTQRHLLGARRHSPNAHSANRELRRSAG